MTDNNKDYAITADNVFKTFKLPHERNTSLKSVVINFYRKRVFERQEVLKDISFKVKKGEFFGIVGRNGGGKSTLLKMLAGIYEPDKGSIKVNGSLTPFIELGVGFNQELTGRENVFLNGALLGFNRKEVLEMYKDIVSFAELGAFMDQKLKNYSSGMQVRLAFSVAIRAKSDILIMDEVLAVGDAAFQKKCFDVFRELKRQGRTIILVTHDMANVERFCDRALVLSEGKILKITTPQEAATIYGRLNIESAQKSDDQDGVIDKKNKIVTRWGVGGISVSDVTLLNEKDEVVTIYEYGQSMTIKIKLEREEQHKLTDVICGLAFYNQDNVNLSGPNSTLQAIKTGSNEITVTLEPFKFASGEYKITVAVYNTELSEPYDFLDKTIKFSIISDHVVHGLMDIKSSWNSR